MKKQLCLISGLALLAAAGLALAQQSKAAPAKIYHEGWIDLNKNGRMDPYENPKLPIEQRIDDLLGQMNLDEKTCQMATLYGYGRVLKDELPTPAWKNEIWKDGIANIDEQLNGYVSKGKTKSQYCWPPSKHAQALNEIQKFFIEQTRLGIPTDFTNEGIRGLCAEKATGFPAQIGQGCTFDTELIAGIGRVTGREAHALGYTNVYSPILDLPRDPRWGRTVECYTEAPYLGTRLGVAQIKALQSEGVAATPKHFAVYSIPKGGRDGDARTDPHASWREIQTINLATFRAAFTEAGALGTMCSYNDYDGIPITGSYDFLTKILRQEYGFKGYVVSDSDAVEYIFKKHHVAPNYKDAVRQAVEAGMNVRTTFTPPSVFIEPLRDLVREGSVSMKTIDDRVRDVLRVKFILGMFDHPYVEDVAAADKIVRDKEHLELARRAAHESLVLLKNEKQTLPLAKNLKSILVCGPNAALKQVDRYGPQGIAPASVLEGIQATVDKTCEVKYAKGCELIDEAFPESDIMREPMTAKAKAQIDEAVKLAAGVDAIVAVVGEDNEIVGESKSRVSLDLPGNQNDLVEALVATGKPVVVVLMNGRPLSINWVQQHAPAILEAWFPGEQGGAAIADVLFGNYNPGGKLSITFPKSVGQIPMNFPCMPGSQAGGNASVDGVLYPFGHGLSYTTFKYSNLATTPTQQGPQGEVTVSVDVENTGKVKGDEIVQLYLRDEVSSVITPEKELRGFKRMTLEPGQKQAVRFTLKPADLQLLDRDMHWTVEPGEFSVMVGSSSEDIRATGKFEIVARVEKPEPVPVKAKKGGAKGKKGAKTAKREKNADAGALAVDAGANADKL